MVFSAKKSVPQHRAPLSRRLIFFFGSETFFWLIVGIFIVQASWIALSARYPQAFDEQFHFGIIKMYAQHLSPFLSSHPAGADQFGAVSRDPSYLYHYLMSFPYRWLTHITGSQTSQIIVLRLLNVVMLASGLIIFRKILRLVPVSKAMAHVLLAFMVLLPVFPLLGSQINYDNLFIPLSGLAIYWTLKFISAVRDEHLWRWDKLAWLMLLCVLASLVKYPFLPIFLAIFIIIGLLWWQQRNLRLAYHLAEGARQRVHLLVLGILLLLGLGLFWQRYGINTVRYYTPIPECNQVLTVQQCNAYGPWARNYWIAQQHYRLPVYQIALYPFDWLYHTMGELVFTISSSFNDDGSVSYYTGDQLILIEIIGWGVLGTGALAVAYNWRYLWRQPALRSLIIISVFYLGALFAQNLRDYMHLGQPLSIHGRYLFPVLPILFVLVALSYVRVLGQVRIGNLSLAARKAGIASVLLVIMLVEGGGFVTYILRSNPSWFWPQSLPAKTVNAEAKKVLHPVVIDTKKK